MIVRSLLVFISGIILYVVVALILSCIPYNTDFRSPEEGVDIYILSNGVHTDLVVPAKSKYMDWTRFIKAENTRSKDSSISYMAFGWGDKGFYLETPEWSDLKCSTALKAMFALGTSAMHVCNYRSLQENEYCRKIRITEENYKKLVTYIASSFLRNNKEDFICISGRYYAAHDAFYEAKGSYSLLKTCNTWANEGLKESGIRASIWTPLDKGIFFHY